ncbi:MAG: hypothetical protein H6577_02485 [Lewinellaceae bacterium]|nr:hypothetical protein [Lewinellaceae bacterium]
MSRIDIGNAILEAIYWWDRDESAYQIFFTTFHEICKNKEDLEVFTANIFEFFLCAYKKKFGSGLWMFRQID